MADFLSDVEEVHPAQGTTPAGGFDLSDVADPSPGDLVDLIDSRPELGVSLNDFAVYRKAKQDRPWDAGRFAKVAGQSLVGLVKSVGRGFKGLATSGYSGRGFGDAVQTGVETVARGTVDLAQSFQLIANRFRAMLADEDYPIFRQRRILELKGKQAFNPEGQPAPLPDAEEQAIRREWDRYKLGRDYERFLMVREVDRERAKAARGEEDLVDHTFGTPNQDIAEGFAPFADLSSIVSGAAGAAAKGGVSPGVASAVGASGRVAAAAGDAVSAVASLPERAARKVVTAVTGSEAAGDVASKAALGSVVGLGAPGVAGISSMAVPGVSEVAAGVAAARAAGAGLSAAGDVAQAVGRNSGLSRWGVLERISKDGQAPSWLRRVAAMAAPVDRVTAVAEASGLAGAARGAAAGAAAGGAMGAVGGAGDSDAVAAGFGGGLMPGAAGGLVSALRTGKARAAAAEDADMASFLARRDLAEIDAVRSLGLDRSQLLRLADIDRVARGVAGADGRGDVQIRFLTGEAFAERFPGVSARGAVPFGSGEVYVNTAFRGDSGVLHEVSHALLDLDIGSAQKQALGRVMFGLPGGPGGMFSASDLKSFGDQYLNKLADSPELQKRLTGERSRAPDEFDDRVKGEVMAEMFAGFLKGRSDLHNLDSVRQRLADGLMTARAESLAGKLRRGLSAIGISFTADGAPSAVFVRDGKPITPSADVNALLADYLRVRKAATERVTSGSDEVPKVVISKDDISTGSGRKIAAAYPDWDGFARNPDGSVRVSADGTPALRSEADIKTVQSARASAMADALSAVRSSEEYGSVREVAPGRWEGGFLTDAQLAAIRGLPDELMPPSMKAKLDVINRGMRAGDGTTFLLDYNAALKNGKYSSGISPTLRKVAPFKLKVSKAGNVIIDTLDVTAVDRKFAQWAANPSARFGPWGGDASAFQADIKRYLDNHAAGRDGHAGLDVDPVKAVQKRNVLNDFFNIPAGESEFNPGKVSGKSDRDILIRSRRFDRINRVVPTEGSLSFTSSAYQRVKLNLLPESITQERGDLIRRSFEALAEGDRSFQLPRVIAGDTPEAIARDYSLPGRPLSVIRKPSPVILEDGRTTAAPLVGFQTDIGRLTVYKLPYDYVDSDGKKLRNAVFIDSGDAASDRAPAGGGSQLYQAALTTALKSGWVVVGDPRGLTRKAELRRTVHLASSALRHGTTKHFRPHEWQRVDYVPGDDKGNLARLLDKEYDTVSRAVPEASSWVVDWRTGEVRDQSGRSYEPQDIAAVADAADPKGPERYDSKGIGAGTLYRSLVARSAIQSDDAGGGARGAREDGLRLASSPLTRGIFYLPEGVNSRDVADAARSNGHIDFFRRIRGVPYTTAGDLSALWFKEFTSRRPSGESSVSRVTAAWAAQSKLSPQELGSIRTAFISGGMKGAHAQVQELAIAAAALATR